MKRSKEILLSGTMVALTVNLIGCDGVDDRSGYAYNKDTPFNYQDEKRLKRTCDKPEDFSLSECHNKNNYQSTPAPTQTTHSSGNGFFMGYMLGHILGGSNYGPATSSARSYTSARQAVNSSGLSGAYRASAVPRSSLSSMGRIGSTIAARSTTSAISRSVMGSTGRSFALGSSRGGFSAAS